MLGMNPYQAEAYEPGLRTSKRREPVSWSMAFILCTLPANAGLMVINLLTPHPELYLDDLPIGYAMICFPTALNVFMLLMRRYGYHAFRVLESWRTGNPPSR
jgi:hypothetical protein